jgi:hypothetical protein
MNGFKKEGEEKQAQQGYQEGHHKSEVFICL